MLRLEQRRKEGTRYSPSSIDLEREEGLMLDVAEVKFELVQSPPAIPGLHRAGSGVFPPKECVSPFPSVASKSCGVYCNVGRIYSLYPDAHLVFVRVSVAVDSLEIAGASLHTTIPAWRHLYAVPFVSLYPLLAYAYYVKYDEWLVSEEWTFLACVSLGAGHALSFLVTKWSAGARAWVTTNKVCIDVAV